MINKLFFLFLFLLNIHWVYSSNEEYYLRQLLFTNYNKYVRPVSDYNNTLEVRMGIAVQNIESFDQMKETLDLNLWVRMSWNNQLNWGKETSNISFISVDTDHIWTPDIELLNAADKPEIYIFNKAVNLYNDGSVFRSNPAIFRFSCPLQLHDFPFDTQECTMIFGSWTYHNKLLTILPYKELDKQLDVLPSFSHSEWDIIDYYITSSNESRICCPGNNFSINSYTFKFKRYPHYYKLSMGMTISLVIVSFIIMLIKPDNISRTGTAVFIPLTILALELTIANKIPVVGYYTLMDKFFLCCFITSMIVSIESGLIFSMITNKSGFMYSITKSVVNLEKRYEMFLDKNKKTKQKKYKHDMFIKKLKNTHTDNGITTTSDVDLEYSVTLQQLNNRSGDTLEGLTTSIENNVATIVDENVVKVINFDDENLSLSLKEKLVFDYIIEVCIKLDNLLRILLPFVFIIYIIVIMSHEK
jgi:hypothetical protein